MKTAGMDYRPRQRIARRKCDFCGRRRHAFERSDGSRYCADCLPASGIDELFRAFARLEDASFDEVAALFADREADLLKQLSDLNRAWQGCGEKCREIAQDRDAKDAVIRQRDAELAKCKARIAKLTEETDGLGLLIDRAAKLLPLLEDGEWDETVSSDHSDLLRAFRAYLGGG